MIDRNRVTGGGVTAGIDFALTIAAEMCGAETAKAIQLLIEYNPSPPFNCAHPANAEASIVDESRRKRAPMQNARMEQARRAAAVFCS